jgi:hypothetical protein
MPNKEHLKLITCGDHALCITNTSVHISGELVDRLQLPFSFLHPIAKVKKVILLQQEEGFLQKSWSAFWLG